MAAKEQKLDAGGQGYVAPMKDHAVLEHEVDQGFDVFGMVGARNGACVMSRPVTCIISAS
jgi:hypothetical protein